MYIVDARKFEDFKEIFDDRFNDEELLEMFNEKEKIDEIYYGDRGEQYRSPVRAGEIIIVEDADCYCSRYEIAIGKENCIEYLKKRINGLNRALERLKNEEI